MLIAVLYCTLLASAQSEDEKNAIRKEMLADSSLKRILAQLENEEVMADYTIRTIKLRHLKVSNHTIFLINMYNP